jgi:hypothetical protein
MKAYAEYYMFRRWGGRAGFVDGNGLADATSCFCRKPVTEKFTAVIVYRFSRRPLLAAQTDNRKQ